MATDSAVLALSVIAATLVALFFLFKVLPWSRPGPWRLISIFATLASALFILSEVQAAGVGGSAIAIEHQGPMFAAILCASTCFILAYLHGPRSVEGVRLETRKELESRNEHLSIVAHELRNPLIAISAASRVLARRDSEAASVAGGIAEEARAALALLDGLTDLTSIESGRLVSALRPIDLCTVVRDTAAASAPDREVRVLGATGALEILGDERRLGEVIRNLVGNAQKFTPAGTTIEVIVGIDPDRRRAVVSVRDYGPGVPPAERKRLFQRFSRLSTAGGTRGSGLGLYICRQIVRDHGGELTADWPAGGGSVFSFTIPLILPRSRV